MKKKYYSVLVDKYIKRIKERQKQKKSFQTTTELIYNETLRGIVEDEYIKLLPVLIFIVFYLAFLVTFIHFSAYSLLLVVTILFLSISIIIWRLFPNILPHILLVRQLKLNFNRISENKLYESDIDIEYINELLMNPSEIKEYETKKLIERYYWARREGWIKLKDKNIDHVLIGLFYVLDKNLEIKKDVEELSFLLGSLVCGTDYKIKTERLSVLNRYSEIKIDQGKSKYDKMISDLDEAKEILVESIKKIDLDIEKINSYKKL